VRAEYAHPVLAKNKRGRPPSIDLFVPRTKHHRPIAIEVKWASKSATLLPDVLRDIIRLDLLVPKHASKAFLIFAGQKRRCDNFFASKRFRRQIGGHTFTILPVKSKKKTIRFPKPRSTWKLKLYTEAFGRFAGQRVSRRIKLVRNGPYPAKASRGDFVVYVWEVSNLPRNGRFTVPDPKVRKD
jgi:hypothetical protein